MCKFHDSSIIDSTDTEGGGARSPPSPPVTDWPKKPSLNRVKDSYLQYGMIQERQSNITDTCCLFTRLGLAIHSVKSVLGPVETQRFA